MRPMTTGIGKKISSMFKPQFTLSIMHIFIIIIVLRFDLAIDIPAEMGDLTTYRATLGHKANWSPDPNAKVTLFTAHPVLGVIMSVVALKDIPAGEEVTIKKNEALYKP